jgi:predicted DCC family thiol-disulfide oxidoreductase YuxK
LRPAGARAAAAPEILFDDECQLCIRSITVVRYADWFDRLTFSGLGARWQEVAHRYPGVSRDDCQREMHVMLPDGSIARGFFAFRSLLAYLPPLWPLIPVFHLPLASRLGPTIYRAVASRRGRFHACEDGVCPGPEAPAQRASREREPTATIR